MHQKSAIEASLQAHVTSPRYELALQALTCVTSSRSSRAEQTDFEKDSNYTAVRVDSEKFILTRLSIHRGEDYVTFLERF